MLIRETTTNIDNIKNRNLKNKFLKAVVQKLSPQEQNITIRNTG